MPASATVAAPSQQALRRAADRVIQRCDELAACTEQHGEITRTFCSPAMQEAHRRMKSWMQSAGMTCRVDAAGNLIGELPATPTRRASEGPTAANPSTQALLIGSHLDSVVNAGKYDGVLGVVIGLALAELIREAGLELPFAFHVIGFSEEEGVRYQVPYTGSRAVAGNFPIDWLDRRDAHGVTMRQALESFSCAPGQIPSAAYNSASVLAYIEPHIEQGPVLELHKQPVGVVTAIAGQTRARCHFKGQAGHAGTVPMVARQDALLAAARFITAVEEYARHNPGLVATVGQIEARPNVSNVIAGEAIVSLDVRHANDEHRTRAFDEICRQGAQIGDEREVKFEVVFANHEPAVACHPKWIALLDEAVAAAGLPPFQLVSGAGHDVVIMGKRFPVGMLFLRCAKGMSHCPEESCTADDVAVALDVLWRLIAKLAAEA